MDIFNRIKQIAGNQGISLTELGIKAGLGSRSIYNWKTNSPTIENLLKVASVLHTDIDNILDIGSNSELSDFHKSNVRAIVNNKNKLSQVLNIYPLKANPVTHSAGHNFNKVVNNTSNNYQVRVPILRHEIAGNELISENNVIDYKDFTFKHKPTGTLFIVNINDNTMSPTIPLNSYVTVMQQSVVKSGEIAAVLINKNIIVRRVRYINKDPVALPDNVSYEPISLKQSGVQIIGKIVHLDVSF